MIIHMIDGDRGFRRALTHLTDAATATVPDPEPGAHFHCQAIAMPIARDGTPNASEVPYELAWALAMMTARLNHHQDEFNRLIQSADDDRRLPDCALMLARLAGQAHEVSVVVV